MSLFANPNVSILGQLWFFFLFSLLFMFSLSFLCLVIFERILDIVNFILSGLNFKLC